MSRGSKSAYTDKQKRKAQHIEAHYEHSGLPHEEAERRAWATVNKQDLGGNQSGSGRGASQADKQAARSDSARRAAQTRKRNQAGKGE